jgi:hypothetical protein
MEREPATLPWRFVEAQRVIRQPSLLLWQERDATGAKQTSGG